MPSFTRESGGTLHVAAMGVNRIGKVETVTAYRNAGVDGFLSLPASSPMLGNFLQGQIEQRKKFVATSDYVGPDRRRDPARSGTECFKVVNSFRLKTIGSPEGEVESQVTTALQKSIARLGASARRCDATLYSVALIGALQVRLTGRQEFPAPVARYRARCRITYRTGFGKHNAPSLSHDLRRYEFDGSDGVSCNR